jgi:hypothetical protein
MYKECMEEIIKSGEKESIEVLEHVFSKAMEHLSECDYEMYEKLEMKLYVAVYGKVLSDDMKRKWVADLSPVRKWEEEETNSVADTYRIDIPKVSFYTIMNVLYSDMKKALGTGDEEESIERYIEAAKGFYNDPDAAKSGEEKLFEYYFHIVK